MEFEFDKEMDALLRQSAQGETAFAANNPQAAANLAKHLDADEISLFAENALPVKIREKTVAHFADCDRCRKILSDLIAQNSVSESVSAKQIKLFAPAIPWYRRLFAFPRLAYAMGALIVVFSGLVAFTILQSVNNSKNSEVSQISERPVGGGGMSSDGDSVIVEKNADTMMSNMSSSSAMSNASISSSSSSMSNSARSNASTNSAARNSGANSASNASTASNKSSASVTEAQKDALPSENEATQRAINNLPLQSRNTENLFKRKQERDKKEDKDESATTDAIIAPAPKPKTEVVAGAENNSSTSDSTAKKSAQSPPSQISSGRRNVRKTDEEKTEIRQTGGKIFERKNNVWIDSAYKNQATINITRGTNEYKKLDSALRAIAENLNGTMIIVWREKAYRIQ